MNDTTTKKPYKVMLTAGQIDALRALSERTRVPISRYAREAIDDVLAKHGARARGGKR